MRTNKPVRKVKLRVIAVAIRLHDQQAASHQFRHGWLDAGVAVRWFGVGRLLWRDASQLRQIEMADFIEEVVSSGICWRRFRGVSVGANTQCAAAAIVKVVHDVGAKAFRRAVVPSKRARASDGARAAAEGAGVHGRCFGYAVPSRSAGLLDFLEEVEWGVWLLLRLRLLLRLLRLLLLRLLRLFFRLLKGSLLSSGSRCANRCEEVRREGLRRHSLWRIRRRLRRL